MSASSNAFWGALRAALRAIGVLPADTASVPTPSIVAYAAPAAFHATIELIDAPEPPGGGTPAALPSTPAPTATPASRQRVSIARPLASQLAFTASRNAPKARCGKKMPSAKRAAATALPRKASTLKAKPVVVIARSKKAPKRRHVWLSNTSRVIRPISSNVVQLNVPQRTIRITPRTTTQKPTRNFKLAA